MKNAQRARAAAPRAGFTSGVVFGHHGVLCSLDGHCAGATPLCVLSSVVPRASLLSCLDHLARPAYQGFQISVFNTSTTGLRSTS